MSANRVVIFEDLLGDLLGDSLATACDITSSDGDGGPHYTCTEHAWQGERTCPVYRARSALHGRKLTDHPARVHLDDLGKADRALADALDAVAAAERALRAANNLVNDDRELAYTPLPPAPPKRWVCSSCLAPLQPVRANDDRELAMPCRCHEQHNGITVITRQEI